MITAEAFNFKIKFSLTLSSYFLFHIENVTRKIKDPKVSHE